MKKWIKKAFALSLAATSLFTAACDAPKTSSTPEKEEEGAVKYTDVVLAENGNTDYSIVLPQDADEWETCAGDDLQRLFEEATGAKLPIISDAGLSYTEEGKYLSISDTKLQKDCGLTYTYEEFGFTGTKLLTKGNTLFLTGYCEQGALYAVYDLLALLFDYEYYDMNAYTIDEKDKVMLPDLDMKNIPDFDLRSFGDVSQEPSYGGNTVNGWRLRLRGSYGASALGGHTNDVIISPEKYLQEHPDWFYPKGASEPKQVEQLCHSNEEMTLEYIKNVKAYIAAAPKATEISLTQVDINSWCNCEDCKALMTKYGTNGNPEGMGAVTQTLFLNKVANALDEWLAEEYPGRVMNYYTYAYHQTVNAPAHKDETGKYVPNGSENGDYSMKLNPHIVVRYADIYANRNKSWADNPSVSENILAWTSLTTNLSIYEYPQDAANVCLPYDGLHVHADNLRFASALGHSNYHLQGNYGTMSSGFYRLRMYVCAKLMWDVSLDPVQLAEDYIQHCYGDAAPIMLEFFNALRGRLAYLRKEYNFGGMCLASVVSSTHWPRTLTLQYENMFDRMYAAIEDLQYVDEAAYKEIFRKIKVEEMFVDYVICSLYLQNFSAEEKERRIDEFEYYAKQYGFTRYHESKPMSDVINAWREK